MELELPGSHGLTWNGWSIVSSHGILTWIGVVWVWLCVSISSYRYGSSSRNGRPVHL